MSPAPIPLAEGPDDGETPGEVLCIGPLGSVSPLRLGTSKPRWFKSHRLGRMKITY
jgi:hypothetical protein